LEQPLLPYESCVLGAINLPNMLKENEIDWDKFQKTIELSTRFLDNVIDINKYPLPELEKAAKKYRKIGIGITGWAELLIRLNLKYGSKESLALAEIIAKFMNNVSFEESKRLGKEKGIPEAIQNLGLKRRNLVTTNAAPTGSRAFIANTSSGIEPFFSFEYTHTDSDGNKSYFKYDFVNDANKEVLVTANDISPEEHVLMQSAWQKYLGAAISKTVNMPNNSTKEDVDKIYRLAYKTECKGITIFRDGSKSEQVLNNIEDKSISPSPLLSRGTVIKAKKEANAKRYRLSTGCGTLWLTVVFDDDNNIVETFADTSHGGCVISIKALSRMISLSLRGGISIENVIDQLLSAGSCPAYQAARASGKKVSPGASCPGAIGLKLREIINQKNSKVKFKNGNILEFVESKEKYHSSDEPPLTVRDGNKIIGYKCPECGAELRQESGCLTCPNCGWSKCE
jgi:ribonucleoside-diphosphate reductase alpha chain